MFLLAFSLGFSKSIYVSAFNDAVVNAETNAIDAYDSIFEAEDTEIQGAIIDNKHLGFTGTGFVDYVPNAPGGTITWIIDDVLAKGEYSLVFRYANGGAENRPAAINVNGETINPQLDFNTTIEWNNWQTVSIKAQLQKGKNNIIATGVGSSGGANIDHLRIHNNDDDIEPGEPEPVEITEVDIEDLTDGVLLKRLKTTGLLADHTNLDENRNMTRIEFFAKINDAMGFHHEEKYKNLDPNSQVWEVSKEEWFSYVLETALKEGYIDADKQGNIYPDSIITRREAAFIIANVLNLAPNLPKQSEGKIGHVQKAGYMNKGKFGKKESLTAKEANQIAEKIAKKMKDQNNHVHIAATEAVSDHIVAVILNGSFDQFDIHAITLKKAQEKFSSLNNKLTDMYPVRAAIGENRFDQTVIFYEVREALVEGKVSAKDEQHFSGNIDDLVKQADILLTWQMEHGGWTKSMDEEYKRPWDGKEARSKQLGEKGEETGTIDNNATIKEIRIVAQAYRETGEAKYKESIQRGIDFLLTMQYQAGGWPQVYPARTTSTESSIYYTNYVTFNDNAMVRVLEFFDDILNEHYPFDQEFLNKKERTDLITSQKKGLDYILKSQNKVDDSLQVWSAQHDPVTYEAREGRSYEHASNSGSESIGIIKFLMSRPNQTPEIKKAVLGALEWFDKVKLEGIRYVSGDKNGVYFVEDPDSDTWYRFYEIGTNLPIFSSRDGIIKRTIHEIEQERRDGYQWGGSYATQLLIVAKETGFYENHVFAEVVHNEVNDKYGRSLVKGESKRVEDSTKALEKIPTKLVVNQNGNGDYKTIQAAVEAIPVNNKEHAEIFINDGIYKEVITIPADKPFIHLTGESKEGTVLTYDNYAKKERPSGGTYGTSGSASVFLYANDISVKNLTLENSFDESTVEGGSQALAAYIRGERMAFDNVRFLGNQDTLLAHSGTQYYHDSYIEGDVDFIFGGARAVFDHCEIVSLDRGSSLNNGYITAASTNIEQDYGFLFINSKFTSNAKAGTVWLGRPWHPGGDASAIGSVIIMNSELGEHIQETGWTDMSGFSANDARFFEYKNTGPGVVLNDSRRQLTESDAAQATIVHVLDGWNPNK